METIAAFVDDAGRVRQQLAPMLGSRGSTRWIVVGCAPRLNHRIGPRLGRAGRRQWRDDRLAAVRAQLQPLFAGSAAHDSVWLLADDRIDETAARLRRGPQGATLRILDARLPRIGADLAPLVADAGPTRPRWLTPVAVSSSLAAVLALAD